jgi:hypothetical protein
MVTLQREATGVVILQASEHLWPEDLEQAIGVFHAAHGVSRNQAHPLLLFVRLAKDFVDSEQDLLQQLLEAGVLPRNRPCRIAFLSAANESEKTARLLERNFWIEIRHFGPCQEHEAKRWLLSAASGPFPPILG